MNGSDSNKYYGKYRGTVINNIDPLQICRLLVQVPDVLGMSVSSWAMPSLPATGRQMGIFALPQVNSLVWVEFEKGDPDYPIWTGCFWGSAAEVPALALAGNPASPSIVLQTTGQNTLMISDMPGPAGGILLKSTTGAMIAINDVGITITNGKGAVISMVGNAVDVNVGGLTVM